MCCIGETIGFTQDILAHDTEQAEPPVGTVGSAGRLDEFTGEYRCNNFEGSYTTFEKVYRVLATSNRHISAPGNGTLEVSLLQGSARFVQTAPDFFSQVGGQGRLVFRRDAAGRVSSAVFSEVPEYTYERLSWAETPGFNQALLLVCMVLFASTGLVAAAAWVVGRFQRAGAAPDRWRAAARWSAGGLAVLNLAFVGGFALEIPSLTAGDFSRLALLLALPIISTILSVAGVAFAIVGWRCRWWSLLARLHYTAVALAAVAFTWFVANWNLLGFQF